MDVSFKLRKKLILKIGLLCLAVSAVAAASISIWFPKPALVFRVESLQLQEETDTYLISIDYPQITGLNNQDIQDQINSQINELINRFRRQFVRSTKGLDLINDEKSELTVTYHLLEPRKNVLAILYDVSEYQTTAAHPNTYLKTQNFDLSDGHDVRLAELFKARTNYLLVISNLCVKELLARFQDEASLSDWIRNGAGPQADNFQVFILGQEGITFYFNPYQVAPYAAGIQKAFIPYSSIQNLLAPREFIGNPCVFCILEPWLQ